MQGNDYTVIKKLKRIKSEEGITLITLVVTIVIILILSTVVISVIFGDNGFLQKVQGIKDSAQQSIADDTEKTNLVFEEYANLMAEDMGIAEPGIPGGAITVESKLKEGDYVYYRNSNNTLLRCAVLYGPENENYAKYGLQVISVEAIEQITMGEDEGPLDYITNNESTRAYDEAIQTLNSAVNKHLNTAYATGVRCVGSSPDDPFGENYVPDDKQLKALGLNNISCVYASRYIENTSPGIAPTEEWWNGHNYGLNSPNGRVFLYGELRYSYVNKQQFFSSKITCPVVPVFTLKPELKIVSGEGTPERPYLLDF